jgi:hypothetical protein
LRQTADESIFLQWQIARQTEFLRNRTAL